MSIMKWLDSIFSKNENEHIVLLNAKIETLYIENSESKKKNSDLNKENIELSKWIKDYKQSELKKEEKNSLETYWNTKRPSDNDLRYTARPVWNSQDGTWSKFNISMDPKIFFHKDSTLPTFTGTNDEIAIKAFNWVKENITYKTDKKPFDYWQFAHETFYLKYGDCEDGMIIMGCIMLNSGVPEFRIRGNANKYKDKFNDFGHAFLTYLKESDNTWYVFDWCVRPDWCKDFGLKWKDAEYYTNVWFSFNRDYIFGDFPKED